MYASQKVESSFLDFAGQKQVSGTRSATNEQVHEQSPLTSFKAQFLQYMKYNIKRQLTQNLENRLFGFQN